jgi:hypothetical protein
MDPAMERALDEIKQAEQRLRALRDTLNSIAVGEFAYDEDLGEVLVHLRYAREELEDA